MHRARLRLVAARATTLPTARGGVRRSSPRYLLTYPHKFRMGNSLKSPQSPQNNINTPYVIGPNGNFPTAFENLFDIMHPRSCYYKWNEEFFQFLNAFDDTK